MRLLLNLVENIFHKNDAEGRALLVRILHCLVGKFATLKVQIAKQVCDLPPSPSPPLCACILSGSERSRPHPD